MAGQRKDSRFHRATLNTHLKLINVIWGIFSTYYFQGTGKWNNQYSWRLLYSENQFASNLHRTPKHLTFTVSFNSQDKSVCPVTQEKLRIKEKKHLAQRSPSNTGQTRDPSSSYTDYRAAAPPTEGKGQDPTVEPESRPRLRTKDWTAPGEAFCLPGFQTSHGK